MGQLLALFLPPQDSNHQAQAPAADLDHTSEQTTRVETHPAVAELLRVFEAGRITTAQLDASVGSARHKQGLAATPQTVIMTEVARGVRDAPLEECVRAHKMEGNQERAVGAAREGSERVQQTVEPLVRTDAEGAHKATEPEGALIQGHSREGSQPFVFPSPEEVAAVKRRIQYKEGFFHVAVAGVAGSGKSSLVNAFRGLHRRDAGAAPVGFTERALQVDRYPDANAENPFVWYEIPGAGAIKRDDWQYFNDQGLYVFDAIVILFDSRFTLTDIAILANARRFTIPTYIVRSKADRYIRNIMSDMGYDSDDDTQGIDRRNELYGAARQQLIKETRTSVQANLENANLVNQRVYIASSSTLLSIVRNKMPKRMIDEVELLHDLFDQVNARRVTTPSDEMVVMRAASPSP